MAVPGIHELRILPLVVTLLLLAGCLERGRPVISDRSAAVTPPKPSNDGVIRRSAPAVSSGKASVSVVPVVTNVHGGPLPEALVVSPGDTLYRIAWRFGLTFEQLARFNGLSEPFTIFPGQRLRIAGAQHLAAASTPSGSSGMAGQGGLTGKVGSTTPTQVSGKPQRSSTATTKQQPAVPRQVAKGAWMWPLPGPPVRDFRATRKGLDFAVTNAVGMAATQSGVVVYEGNGIGGFERLIIIKHSQTLLSAYSFNGKSLVAEQQSVKAGQKIADIRDTGHKSQRAHFELRRAGAPVDPMSWLRPL